MGNVRHQVVRGDVIAGLDNQVVLSDPIFIEACRQTLLFSDLPVQFGRPEVVVDWLLHRNGTAGRGEDKRHGLSAQLPASKPEQLVLNKWSTQRESAFLAV